MSTTDRHLSGRTFNIKNFYPLTMLSLNDVFKESMRKVLAGSTNARIITRCENLPSIAGNKEDIGTLFEDLFRIIVSGTAVPDKLFLYVDCEETKDTATADLPPEGFKTYTIKFRTNISPDENWEATHMQVFTKCRRILSIHNAIFLVNSSNQTGCIFSISLPGKF